VKKQNKMQPLLSRTELNWPAIEAKAGLKQ
jgi:hypothetical protein